MAAPTLAMPKRLPLVSQAANRDSSVDKDARLINCYLEKHDGLEGTEYWLFKRPGLDEHSRPPAGNATGRGVFNWRGDLYSIFGATVYKNGVALVGSVDTSNGGYRFDSCLGATPRLVLGNGVEGYYYDAGGGLVNISDVDFPTAFVKGWGYLDAGLYVMRPDAHIQGSEPNDPSDWDPVNDILAQIDPDRGVALTKQLVYIIGLKEWSTEVFYDAGNATGSPLGPVQGAKSNFGCGSADSVQEIAGTLFFISVNRTAGRQIVMMEGLKPEPVSTPSIERILQAADLSSIFSWQLALDGHSWYVVTLKADNLTFAYDIGEKLWHQWADENGDYCKVVAASYTSSGEAILQHESNGRLYLASADYTSDDGAAITMDVFCPNFDAGVQSRPKTLTGLVFVGDQTAGSELIVRHNDRDFDPTAWSDPRTVDMGLEKPRLENEGSFDRRAYWIRHQSNTKLRLRGIELQLDIGSG